MLKIYTANIKCDFIHCTGDEMEVTSNEGFKAGEILSFKTLHICSKMIPASKMEFIGLQLGLTQNDMETISYEISHYYPSATSCDKALLILTTWKTNFPDRCTLHNLEQTLRHLSLYSIVDNLKQTLNKRSITSGHQIVRNNIADAPPVHVCPSADGTLRHEQLRICSNKIGINSLEKVGRQLGLTCSDFEEIDYKLRISPVNQTMDEKKLLVLEAWKARYPTKCTTQTLEQCLRSLCLNKTADDMLKALSEKSAEHSLLDQDDKCQSKMVISEVILSELSKLIGGKSYKNLGFELGFSRGELESMEYQCGLAKEPLHGYTLAVLREWRNRNCEKALLGSLYKALRKMICNDVADKVYHFVLNSCSSDSDIVKHK